jgi:hypothetical protein
LVCFTFDCNQYDYVKDGFTLIGGSDLESTGEVDDPKPIYMRGAYFDGNMFF